MRNRNNLIVTFRKQFKQIVAIVAKKTNTITGMNESNKKQRIETKHQCNIKKNKIIELQHPHNLKNENIFRNFQDQVQIPASNTASITDGTREFEKLIVLFHLFQFILQLICNFTSCFQII